MKKSNMKRRLSEAQEFEIMKLVLDKFLWISFAVMAFGLYNAFTASIYEGLTWIFVGIVLLLLFTWIITKEYEIVR